MPFLPPIDLLRQADNSREAYVLAYIDGFWLIAWVLTAGIALMLFLRRPPPNPLTPPRNDL